MTEQAYPAVAWAGNFGGYKNVFESKYRPRARFDAFYLFLAYFYLIKEGENCDD